MLLQIRVIEKEQVFATKVGSEHAMEQKSRGTEIESRGILIVTHHRMAICTEIHHRTKCETRQGAN